jgi:Flp pilus assembly protein TadG
MPRRLFTTASQSAQNVSGVARPRLRQPGCAARFAADAKGSVGIIFALSTIVTVSLVGGAVDFGRAFSAREQAQSSADTAVLAAARVWQTENDPILAIEKGTAQFAANRPADLNTDAPVITVDPATNTVRLSVNVRSPSPFLSVAGTDTIEFSIEAHAKLARGATARRSLEISMMLDVTGSMAGEKIASLKSAAKDLVDIVVWDDGGHHTARVALVPFAEGVRPGPYLDAVRGSKPASHKFMDVRGNSQTYKLSSCVSDRKGSDALTDAAPGGTAKVGPIYTASGACTPANAIMPLTDDKVALKTHIDGFTPSGMTAGQIGTQWAWYMLSPEWNAVWPAASRAGAYGAEDVTKVAILMTDGEYNQAYDAAGVATQTSGRASANGTADGHARQLCESMKQKGIVVFSIGFELGSETAQETLRGCATDASHAYMADDGEKLRLVFRDIAQRLSTFHLSQ